MSDIEREEFERAVTERWSDSYSFTRFGDEDYYDEVLEGMWWGWQASRQEGEPIGFLQFSGVSQLSGGHPAKLYPIGATPSPFESNTFVYTHPASAAPDEEYLRALQDACDIIQADANTEDNYGSLCRIGAVLAKLKATPTKADDWIKCSDRLPAEHDGDFEGLVWVNDRDMTLPKYAQSRVHWSRVRGIAGYTHWMPTNLVRPEPRQQEQGHE